MAVAAAMHSPAPVLVVDLGGPAAGISALAGVHSGQSFTTAAEHLTHHRRPPGALFATGEYGLRALASRPELDESVQTSSTLRLLAEAKAAHALTVVDCAQLTRPVERDALSSATHVAWIVSATPSGCRRGAALLRALRPIPPGREILVARNDPPTPAAPLDQLAAIADQRGAPLLLLPKLDDLADAVTDTITVLGQAAVALEALGWFLRR